MEVHTSQVKATSILFLILYKVGYTQTRKTNHFGIQVKSEAKLKVSKLPSQSTSYWNVLTNQFVHELQSL